MTTDDPLNDTAPTEPRWLTLSRELQAIAQAGLAYSRDPFDLQRFTRLLDMAAEMAALQSTLPHERILDLFKAETGYPTPKGDVRGGVFRAGKILLVRERQDGRWSLPGGWADVNQTPTECVEREILEESGYHARATKLAAVWDARKRNAHVRHHCTIYKLFFLCELLGGKAAPSIETEAADFFAIQALPALSLGRTTHWQIRRMFEHLHRPGRPTDFD